MVQKTVHRLVLYLVPMMVQRKVLELELLTFFESKIDSEVMMMMMMDCSSFPLQQCQSLQRTIK